MELESQPDPGEEVRLRGIGTAARSGGRSEAAWNRNRSPSREEVRLHGTGTAAEARKKGAQLIRQADVLFTGSTAL